MLFRSEKEAETFDRESDELLFAGDTQLLTNAVSRLQSTIRISLIHSSQSTTPCRALSTPPSSSTRSFRIVLPHPALQRPSNLPTSTTATVLAPPIFPALDSRKQQVSPSGAPPTTLDDLRPSLSAGSPQAPNSPAGGSPTTFPPLPPNFYTLNLSPRPIRTTSPA